MMRHIGLLAVLGSLMAMLGLGLNPDLGMGGDPAANEPVPTSRGLAWND